MQNKEKKVFFCTLILALCIMSGVFFPKIQYISMLMGMGLVLYFPNDAILALFFVLPFAPIFKFSPSSSSMFTYLELFYVLVAFVRNRFINKHFLIALIMFTFYTMLGGVDDPQGLIKMIAIPSIVYLGLQNDTDFKKITVSFSAGIVVSSIIAFFI